MLTYKPRCEIANQRAEIYKTGEIKRDSRTICSAYKATVLTLCLVVLAHVITGCGGGSGENVKTSTPAQVSVTTPASEPTADTEAPTVPQNLTATATNPTQVNLVWDASTDLGGGVVAGYVVWRDNAKVWGGVGITGTSFIDTGAEPGTSYIYRVVAFDNASPRNSSANSNLASVTTPSSSVVCNGVDILPSYDAAALISANPEGTTFCFKAGTHFLSAPIQTHSNDKYIGESGAILDGQDAITHAFFGRGDDQRDVTIRGFVIQNFHSIYEDFNTRNTIRSGNNWTVENNEIRYNYETGIHVNRGMILRNNNIHHNGRYGITGGPGIAQNILIDGNEIAYNNSRDLPWATAGTAKVVGSAEGATGLTWTNNWIHHNNGHGLHHDYNAGPDIEIAFNRIEDNLGSGIQHEGSWGADIHNNVIINSAKLFIGKSCGFGGQIRILNSSDVNIYNNYVESTEGGNGICLRDATLEKTPPASVTINNVSVIGNTVKLIGSAQTGVVGPDADAYNRDKNFFDLNTYYVPDPDSGNNWTYYITRAEWQAKGQDLGSVFLEW